MQLRKILHKATTMDFYIYSLVPVYSVVLLDNTSMLLSLGEATAVVRAHLFYSNLFGQ